VRLRRGQFVDAGPHRHELHPGPKSDPLLAESDLAVIGWLYLLTNATRVVNYIPQIVAVWRCTDGALSMSLLTRGSWVLSNLTAKVYDALVVRDTFFVFISLVNLAGCAAVAAIAARRRLHWQRAV
jgi:hypothetical protein